MKKQMFLALILLCAGISLNAMSTDMEAPKDETAAPAMDVPATKEEVAPAVTPAPVKEEDKVAPKEDEEDNFELDLEEEDSEGPETEVAE
jgi:hypothetical protein